MRAIHHGKRGHQPSAIICVNLQLSPEAGGSPHLRACVVSVNYSVKDMLERAKTPELA
jgi:hypothetical protein